MNYNMHDFSDIPIENILFKGEKFNIIKDGYPVSAGHCLIVTKKIKKTFFDLNVEEKQELLEMIDKAKEIIEKEHQPDGYNIGMNCGETAGQTIEHFHCHVIPRYKGDMDNPKGGIRHCIKGKGYY